jgi:lipoteichoic acid synthase
MKRKICIDIPLDDSGQNLAETHKHELLKRLALAGYYWLSIVYLELIFRAFTQETFGGIGLMYIVLFSLPLALLFYFLSSLFAPKANKAVGIIIMCVLTLFYLSQLIYERIFYTYYTAFSVGNGGQVFEFWKQVLSAMGKNVFPVLLLLLPLCTFLFWGNRIFRFFRAKWTFSVLTLVMSFSLHFLVLPVLQLTGKDELSAYDLYYKTQSMDYSVQNLGLYTAMRLDVKRLLFGFSPELNTEDILPPEDDLLASASPSSNPTEETDTPSQPSATAPVYKPNVMNIDFNTLIANETDQTLLAMHEYFKAQTPSMTNEKTGLAKGANLILITAEGFSPYAVDENLTPTLYKMVQEGYQFTNFYTPIWGVSTSDGEYVACQGLIPKSGVWSFKTSANNYLPFVMGRQFEKLGYQTFAYHNHTYTYYGRDLSHPNMGYTYKAKGHGLDVKDTWPESDIEMIDKTTSDYLNGQPFHAYYMTVSGHMEYNFSGNYIAYKNRDLTAHLNLSEECRAYLSCNIELDRAMELLLQRLEEAGVAENTLIAISPDHYPYGLTNEKIGELAGHEIEENFELYRGIFILYQKGMTPQVIDKPASSLDILPTISNLLGLEYDSRLLMGRDIFSDSDPLVIFDNRSFITDKIMYNAKTKEVTNLTGETLPEDYLPKMKKIVSDKFMYSAKILEENYYGKIFGQ